MKTKSLVNSWIQPSNIPGFRITFGFTLIYLAFFIIIPLSGLFIKSASLTFPELVTAITSSRVMHAYLISFSTSLIAALINAIFGFIVAWVLVRYRFPGRRIIDAMVDLPFALPTAVAGIALTAIYSPSGPIGKLFDAFDIKIAFTPIGITIALILIGLPFVVRSVQPVLQTLEKSQEEVSASLGASRWQTFIYVIFPTLLPALLAGFAMAFARGLGEYGSVIFIAGNIPGLSEIVPVIIMVKLEQFDYAGASAVALVMLLVSFIILLIINLLQKWSSSRTIRR